MISAPISQSIRFRPLAESLSTFDNTFSDSCRYIQYLPQYDLKVQVSRINDELAESKLYIIDNGTETEATKTDTIIAGRIYSTFTLPLADYNGKTLTVKVIEDFIDAPAVTTHISEPFTVGGQPSQFTLNPGLIRLDWFNTENAFMLDYSTGLVNTMLIEAKLWRLSVGGTSSIYSNQGEDIKLKATVTRIFLFECDVPDYIAETISLAFDHDRIFINGIEYVTTKKPTLTQKGSSCMYSFSQEVQQKVIIGLNTHDVG